MNMGSRWLLLASVCALAGCDAAEESAPDPVPTAPQALRQAGGAATSTDGDSNPVPDDSPAVSEPASQTAPSETIMLEAEGLSFRTAKGWKKVQPKSRIVAFEFEIPRAEGDLYDGRLTITPSGGSPDEAIAARTAEFRFEQGHGPTRDTLEVDGMNVTLVDLRGSWRGANFDPLPEPRPGYRMLLAIIDGPAQNVYAKLVGPEATLSRHEEAFRAFVKSARKHLPRPLD